MCECGLLVDGKCLNYGKKHEKKEKQSLVIWFKNGNAAKFEQVENFVNETASNGKAYMRFSYFGVSTQVKRQAVFVADNIAGFALEQ